MRRDLRGRGTGLNPKGRFERIEIEADPDLDPAALERPPTLFLKDASRSVIATNSSPDVPFEQSLNPYRGCEHGCAYCYARPTHEFLGFSAGLDFETRILVKENAPELLRRELAAHSYEPKTLALSGVTDPYQPVERRLELTRRCLEVLLEARHPVGMVTKNHLVTRDADLLEGLAVHDAVSVSLSITTLDGELARRLEPRASHPRRRLEALRALTAAGIPCGVLIAPVIPGLNDHEMPAILEHAATAGAGWAGHLVLRLPRGVEQIFLDWLEHHYPERKEKIVHRLRDLRGGRLSDSRFGHRMRGHGPYAEQVKSLFEIARRKAGLGVRGPALSNAAFRRPKKPADAAQMELF